MLVIDTPSQETHTRGTLLLLHAFPLNADMWEPQQSLAAAGWRIVAPHFPGLRDERTSHGSFDVAAAAVIDECAGLGVVAPVVAGVSMGGYLAFAMLRRSPTFARGLVLCDTRAEADPPEARAGRLKMQTLLQEKGVGAVADEMIPRLLGESTRQERPAVMDRVRSIAESNQARGVGDIITAMMNRVDSTPTLSAIACPSLIVVGDQDVITPPALSEAMHRAIAGSEMVVLDRTGHLPNLEQPDRFNAELLRFLAKLS